MPTPQLPSDEEFRRLFASLPQNVRAKVIKQLVLARVEEIGCTKAGDLNTLSQILTFLFKKHR